MAAGRHLLHRWRLVELIGLVATYRCTVPGCPKTKTRVLTREPSPPDGSRASRSDPATVRDSVEPSFDVPYPSQLVERRLGSA
jgi:hypothetical protein